MHDTVNNQQAIPDPFADAQAVAEYAERPPRLVPGFDGMQRMARLLLAERVPDDARILVLGAGGGLELKAFAEAQRGWTFDGVDPAPAMLNLAKQTLGPLAARVALQEGYIDDAPDEPFDGATCLLTFHFLTRDTRRHTLAQIRRRLKPGAPFVLAHLSIAEGAAERARWLARYSAYAVASGVAEEKAIQARTAIDRQLTILAPEDDEAMLREAGFKDVTLFYVGFTFRGWVGYA